MEFLTTYGWAILVVLAAIGTLAHFGVLSPGNLLPSKCTMSGGFSCNEFKISEANGIELNIQNNLGEDTTSAVVSVKCISGCVGEASVPFASGLENGGITGLVSFPVTVPADAGKVNAEVSVNYIKSGETLNHNSSGGIKGRSE
jgi:hypothetical protein